MRNLKRALSLALAAAMVIGMMVIGAGAADVYEDFTDKDEIQNKEAVATMVALGVLAGKEDGSYFDPTGTVTRAEMAKIVAVSLNGGQDPVMGDSGNVVQFTDVPTTHWAYNYIAYCVQQNIIAGRGDGTFGPEDPVTGSAAAKMFLCALGYRADLEGLTGNDWELNTNILANQDADLYDGLSGINASAGLSRDNTAQMCYNAVQAQEVTYNNLQGDYSGVLQTEGIGTMLSRRFGVIKVEGIVVGNEEFSLDAAPQRAGRTRISFLNVTDYNPDGSGITSGTFNVSTTADLIGQEVVLYVRPTSKLSPNPASDVVLGNQAILAESNVVVTTSDRYNASTTTTFTKFLSNNGLTNGGDSYINYESSGNITTNARGVELTIIDHDDDGVVDYKLAVYKSLARVSVYNTTKEELTLSNGTEYDFEDVVGVEDIAVNDYVLYFESNGKMYVEKCEPVTATLESYVANSTVTLDGTTYNMSALGGMQDGTHVATISDLIRFNNTSATMAAELGGGIPNGTAAGEMELGGSYDLYLDTAGNIIAYEEAEGTTGNYAVVLETILDSNSMNSAPSGRVSLLLADGTRVSGTLNIEATQKNYEDADAAMTTARAFADKYVAKTLDCYDANGDSNTDSSNDTSLLAGTIVTYESGNNGYVLEPTNYLRETATGNYIANNDNGTVGTTSITSSTQYVKNMTSLNMGAEGGGTLITNSSTIFLFSDGEFGTENVYLVTGAANLSSTAGLATDIKAVAYNERTGVAEVVYIMADPGTSTSSYAYVEKDPSVQTVDGTTYEFYKAVLADGSTIVFQTEEGTGLPTGIYKYTTNNTTGVTELDASAAADASTDYLSASSNSASIVNAEPYDYVSGRISALDGNVATIVDANGTGSFRLDVGDKNVWYVDDVEAPTELSLAVGQQVLVAFTKDDNKPVVDAIYVTELYSSVYTLSVNGAAVAGATYQVNDTLNISTSVPTLATAANKAIAYYQSGSTFYGWNGSNWTTRTYASLAALIADEANLTDVKSATSLTIPGADVYIIGQYDITDIDSGAALSNGGTLDDSDYLANITETTAYYGQSLVITVTKTATGDDTGNVTVKWDGNTVGTITVANIVATTDNTFTVTMPGNDAAVTLHGDAT